MLLDLNDPAFGRERLENILDFLPYPFLISIYRRGTYRNLYLNQKFDDEIGFSLDEIPTIEAWFELAYPDKHHREEVIAGWNERSEAARRAGENFVMMRVLMQTKRHGKKWYEVKSSLNGDWQLVAFINIDEQLTHQTELQRINDNKNQVLSVLSHDLRGPLQSLQTVIELAARKHVSPDEFDSLIHLLYEKNRQIIDLLDTTLVWAKSNFARVTMKKVPVDMKAVMTQVANLYAESCRDKDIQFSFMLLDECPVTDADVITIVARNLVSNAVKFTPEGGSIEVSSRVHDGRYVLEVKDTGVGMTEETIGMIRALASPTSRGTRHEKGHGVGLSLCQQLVKRLDGDLEIASEPGRGTSVRVVLAR